MIIIIIIYINDWSFSKSLTLNEEHNFELDTLLRWTICLIFNTKSHFICREVGLSADWFGKKMAA